MLLITGRGGKREEIEGERKMNVHEAGFEHITEQFLSLGEKKIEKEDGGE